MAQALAATDDSTGKVQHISRSVPVEEQRSEHRRRALRACQEAFSQAKAAGEDIADAFRDLERQLAAKVGL